jgi:hypothetical protein
MHFSEAAAACRAFRQRARATDENSCPICFTLSRSLSRVGPSTANSRRTFDRFRFPSLPAGDAGRILATCRKPLSPPALSASSLMIMRSRLAKENPAVTVAAAQGSVARFHLPIKQWRSRFKRPPTDEPTSFRSLPPALLLTQVLSCGHPSLLLNDD